MTAVSPLQDRIRLELGDITRLAVDAIVNAANSSLLGGGGVDEPSTGRPAPNYSPSAERSVAARPAKRG